MTDNKSNIEPGDTAYGKDSIKCKEVQIDQTVWAVRFIRHPNLIYCEVMLIHELTKKT